MMTIDKSLFFAVFAAILIAGCTSSATTTTSGPGIAIKEFKFSPETLKGDQSAALSLVLQNTGSIDVTDGYFGIYGFGKDLLWKVQKAPSSNAFTLRAQSGVSGNIGEEKKFVWLVKNNDVIPKNIVRPYTANARICYTYYTKALGRIEVLSENEWMSRNPPLHEIYLSQKTAPVRITVLSKQPVIKSDKISLDVTIENVGSGTVAKKGYCQKTLGSGADAGDDLNLLTLVVGGITAEKCTASVGETGEVFLERGTSEKLTVDCTVTGNSDPQTTADAIFELEYDYYIDAKANVRVKGPNGVTGDGAVVTPGPTIPITLVGTEAMDTGGKTLISGCSTTAIIDVGVATSPIKRYKFGVKTNNDKIEVTYAGETGDATVTKSAGDTFDIIKNDAHGVRLKYTAAPTCATEITLY